MKKIRSINKSLIFVRSLSILISYLIKSWLSVILINNITKSGKFNKKRILFNLKSNFLFKSYLIHSTHLIISLFLSIEAYELIFKLITAPLEGTTNIWHIKFISHILRDSLILNVWEPLIICFGFIRSSVKFFWI